MFCAKCGTLVEEGSKFCQKCGTPVGQAAAPPPAATAPPVGFQPAAAIKTSGMAVASLVLGIVGMVFVPFVPSVLAIIFGAVGMSQINRSNGLLKGKGMATAGIVLGIISIAFMIIMVVWVGLSWSWISDISHEFNNFTY
jgi:hypothetical protein